MKFNVRKYYFSVSLVGLFTLSVVHHSSASKDVDLKAGYGGKKQISFSTLLSILKTRTNGTRPVLSPEIAQQFGVQIIPPSPQPASLEPPSPPDTAVVPPPLPPKEHLKICSPASKEKSRKVMQLCSGRRDNLEHYEGQDHDAGVVSNFKCLENFCVIIIPSDAYENEEEEEDIESVFGKEVVAYTECDVAPNLFKIFEKTAMMVTPKCYECSI